MALGIPESTGGGSGLPYIKFDSKAGRWFRRRKDNEQSDVDITDKFMGLFDFATIRVGWASFQNGGAPAYVMVNVGERFPAKPEGDGWKMGYRILISLPQSLGGGTYEQSSTARCVVDKIDALHNQYLASPESKTGKIPVLRMEGVEMIETKTPHGTNRNYAPRLVITGWQNPPASQQQPKAAPPPPDPEPPSYSDDLNDEIPF